MAESTDMEFLQESFRKFAIYGDTKATGHEMNGKNWAKLCKDCKVIDGKGVTSTDVDIVFSKVKAKSSRVISFEEFKRALEELAPKRFKDKSNEEAFESICQLVAGKEPTNVGVTCAGEQVKPSMRGGCPASLKNFQRWRTHNFPYVVQSLLSEVFPYIQRK